MAVKNRRRNSRVTDGNAPEAEEDKNSSINESVNEIEHQLDEIREATSAAEMKQVKKKGYKESRRFVFFLGALIGVLIAVYFGARNDAVLPEFDFDKLVNFETLSDYLDDFKTNIPSNFQSLLSEYLTQKPGEGADFSESFAVGNALKEELGLQAKHPVIMIPGVISTGIESWGLEGTEGCPSTPHFRKRLWGSAYMLKAMFLDKACWLKHITLDYETGLDPPGIKLRAAQGFEAADFFMAGYWIWNKVLENLAAIGYEPNRMVTAAYDWRLSYLDLERRDAYFTRLKQQIEVEYETTGEKSILVGHSMGSQIAFYFMKWVEAEGENFGNGGSNWVNKYIYAFVDVSGSMLGAPKTIPALLSGEMKDTVQLNALAVYGLEKFFSRRERLDMLRSFGGVASMLPKGGDLIWGNLTNAFEDRSEPVKHINEVSFGNFIRFDKEVGQFSNKNLTVGESIEFILDTSPEWFNRRTREHYSYGVAKSAAELKENNKDFSKWVNPLEVALPNAPDLKIFCFYGVGNPTERAYIYQEEENKGEHSLNVTIRAPTDKKPTVFFTDGDGTIPLLTHSMCHKWKTSKAYNPGGAQVKVVELKHDPDRFDLRGGAKTAEHVDVLGSAELNELVLLVAGGRDDKIEEKIVTDLPQWVEEMDFGFD